MHSTICLADATVCAKAKYGFPTRLIFFLLDCTMQPLILVFQHRSSFAIIIRQLLRVDAAVNPDVQPAPELSYELVSPHEHFKMITSTGELELIDEV